MKFKVMGTCWGAVEADNAHDRANGLSHHDVADLRALLSLVAHHGRLVVSTPTSLGGHYYIRAGSRAMLPPDLPDGPVTFVTDGLRFPDAGWKRVPLGGPGEWGDRPGVEIRDLDHFADIVNKCGEVVVTYLPGARMPFLLQRSR